MSLVAGQKIYIWMTFYQFNQSTLCQINPLTWRTISAGAVLIYFMFYKKKLQKIMKLWVIIIKTTNSYTSLYGIVD